MTDADHTAGRRPPSQFFGNVVRELRKHWVDREAERQGVDPHTVTRALIIGNSADAEVRIGDEVQAAVLLGDDQIVSLDEAVTTGTEPGAIRAVVPDLLPEQPHMLFDLELGHLTFDLRRRRVQAERHLHVAEQFRAAAALLIRHQGFGAACENLFAAAELATMALMEAGNEPLFGHPKRAIWLEANAAGFGLSQPDSEVLGKLLTARNSYRYGDTPPTITAAELVGWCPHVDKLLDAARELLEAPSRAPS